MHVIPSHRFVAVATAAALIIIALSSCPRVLAQAGQTGGPAAPAPLTVATKPTPPFAMKSKDGRWSGLAIDLMDEVTRKLGRTIKWVEVKTTAELLDMAAKTKADAAIAAITVTAERENTLDFSHGYYDSGLAVAVRRHHGASLWAGLRALSSPAFLGTVGILTALLLVTGAIVWLVESRKNAQQFEKHPVKGIGSGFWWAAVTMTTVGYGDKAPITPLGRLIAVIWMFAALILTAVFTAQITTALTLDRLTGPVTSVRDLAHSQVGIVEGTASREYFEARAIPIIPFDSIQSGLDALEAGLIDAFVHDEPILRYDIRRSHGRTLELLPEVFDAQVYGIAMPSGSKLREPLNQALLSLLASPRWTAIRTKYFGRSPDAP
jgi:ABC-type amino acid transport substrate-binding protein